MQPTVRVLLVEDQRTDAELIERELRRAQIDFIAHCVETEPDFRAELESFRPDVILSDYHLPLFSGEAALSIAQLLAPDVPFIFISGAIGEERAVAALKEGATDYLIKNRLERLGPAVKRALHEAGVLSEKRETERALAYRAAFEHLISGFSTEFINLSPDKIDWSIEEALKKIGEFTDVDRSYVFLLRPDGVTMDNTHEWVREGIGATKQSMQNLPVDAFPWAFEKLRRSEEMHVPRVRDLGAEAAAEKEILETQEVQSILIVPMVAEGLLIGLVGFDSVREPKTWSDDTIALIRLIGTIFANAIARKRHSERLTAMTRQNELILDSVVDGIYGLDAEGCATFVNPALLQMLGFEESELLGHSIHELIHHTRADGTPFPADQCPIYLTLRDGQVQSHVRDVFWTRQGTPISIEYSCSPIRQENVISGCVVTFSDISRRLLLEEQLEREKRLSSLGRIAATIAHEINNVLMAIQTFADLSRKVSAGGDPRLGRALTHIVDAVQRGKGITGDILRFTRPAPPRMKEVEMVEWMRNFVSMMRGVIREDIKLELDVHDDAVVITADPAQLNQVFSNLLLNARDAISGPGSVSVSVALPSESDDVWFDVATQPMKFAHLSVRDSGVGIDGNQMSLIFEPLFTTKQHGTGLGLAVAHQIVTAHGGLIFVESEVGAGTTFHLFLPLCEPRPTSETTPVRSSL